LLKQWIEANREALRRREHIRARMRQWEEQDKDKTLLLPPGLPLEEGRKLLADHGDVLIEEVQPYITASIAADVALRNQEEADARQQQVREQAQLRALAEAERQRAQEQARATQRLRRRAGALAVLFVLAMLGAVFAWRQQQQAERFAQKAQVAQRHAESEQARAEQAHTLAIARQLAAQAELTLVTPPVHLVRSTLLATESLRRAPTLEGYRIWAKAMALLPRDVRRLEHQGQVQKLAFSPDGKQLATLANQGGTHEQAAGVAQLLNPTNGETRARIEHRGWVTAIAFSPDGRWLATASWDYTVAMSEVATGHEVYRLQHEAPVLSLAFSPDGQRLATATHDGLVRLWDTASATPVLTLRREGSVQAVAFSPDGQTIATASDDKTARLWNSATGEELRSFPHPSQVMQVAYDPQGRWLATVHSDRQSWRATARGEEAKMRLWNVASGQLHLMLDHGDYAVRDVVFTPNGTRIVTTSGQIVRVWDMVTGDALARFDLDDFVQKLVLSRDGRWLVTIQRSGKHVFLWDLYTAQQQCRVAHDKDARAAAFSRDGSQLATAGDDHTLRRWSTASCQAISRAENEGVGGGLIFSPDGQLLASSIRLSQSKFIRGEIDVWDPSTGAHLQRIGDYPRLYTGITYSADGRLLATGSSDRNARVWDIHSGHEQARLEHRGRALSLAFTPDATHLITYSAGKTGLGEQAQIWRWATGHTLGTITESGNVWHMLTTADRTRVATTGIDGTGTLRLWDAESGGELYHFQEIYGVSLNMDGTYLATRGNADTAIHVRQLASNSTIARLTYKGSLALFTLGPQAKFLAADINSENREIWIWDVASEALLARLSPPRDIPEGVNPAHYRPPPFISLAFSPDGTLLCAGRLDEKVYIWNVTTQDLIGQMASNKPQGPGLCRFSPDSRRLVTTHITEKVLRIWDIPSFANPVQQIAWGDKDRRSAFPVLSRNGRLAFGTGHSIQVWDLKTGTLLFDFPHQKRALYTDNISFGADGQYLAAAGYGMVVCTEIPI
jgi:YD repeat-containing protein